MSREWILQYYFVAFIDVLGQSKELLKLDRMPMTLEEKGRASDILNNTAGNIIGLREGFRIFFRECKRPTGILDSLPPDRREIAERARRVEVIINSVSDAIIIAVPLSNEEDHCVSIGSIYSALYAICGIFLTALAENKPFRGGIDIGIGVPLTKNEVYGSALVKAYRLEHNIAKYPRIVVGDTLVYYLNMVQHLSSDTDYAKLAKKWAGDCEEFIVKDKDEDKIKILDVIGNGVRSIPDGYDSTLVEKAYAFIVQSHERYRKSGDNELFERYGYLRSYFESKLSLWGIKPTE